jgi:cytochrome b
MKKIFVYDLPTRLFHWLFSLSFIAAFSIAKLGDDESIYYSLHMILGFFMTYLVVMRIAWGLFGSEHSLFKSMPLKINELLQYFKNFFKNSNNTHLGHNPASSWVLIIMSLLTILLAMSGVMMNLKIKKYIVEEFHEIFGNLFFLLSILHVAGIAFHSLKFKDKIALSMISGHKLRNQSSVELNSKQHYLAGFLFIFITLLFASFTYNSYDMKLGKISVAGYTLPLGEGEGDGAEQGESEDGK